MAKRKELDNVIIINPSNTNVTYADKLEQLYSDESISRVFATGAKRDSNSNKPFIHNLKGYTRQRYGYHTNLGSAKYGDGNFLKGIPTEVALESLDRHLAAFMEGDRSEDHLSAIIFGAQLCMLNEQREGIQSDFYFKQQLNKQKDEERREQPGTNWTDGRGY
jgi:hypothetical protein